MQYPNSHAIVIIGPIFWNNNPTCSLPEIQIFILPNYYFLLKFKSKNNNFQKEKEKEKEKKGTENHGPKGLPSWA